MTTNEHAGGAAAHVAPPAAPLCGGTGSMYNRGCRCPLCTEKARQYMATYRKHDALRGLGHKLPTDRVPVEPTLKLITHAHNDLAINFRDIARMCHASRQTIEDIYYQERKGDWILRATEEKIAAGLAGVHKGTIRGKIDGSRVPTDDYRWLVYCLYAQGWTAHSLRTMLVEAHFPNTWWMAHFYEHKTFRLDAAKQVLWLVDTIGDRHGPSMENKRRMQRRGIFPLIHYNENGRLLVSSLTPEQKLSLRQVQSKHGRAAGRDHGDGLRS